MAKTYKAMKLRLYPNKTQTEYFFKNIGCCRFVYNHYLDKRKTLYEEKGEKFSRNDCTKDLTTLKKELEFLKEADATALCWSINYLDTAFKNFFRTPTVGYPKFKSKYGSNQSFTVANVKVENNAVILPKIGRVKAHGQREFENAIYKAGTITYAPSGKFYISIRVELESEVTDVPINKEKVLGLSFKASSLYVDSNGKSAEMPKFYKDASENLAHEQMKLSKMVSGSNNYKKQRMKVARVNEHIANQRNNFIHNLTSDLADKYDLICVEDVSIKGMINNLEYKEARKSILDSAWSKFIDTLTYKMKDRGKKLIKVSSEVPLSHICSQCGAVVPNDTKIKDKWICSECGTELHKSINTAINIKNQGYTQYLDSIS